MKHLPVARGPERGSTVIKNKLHHLATAWSLISVRAVPVSVFFCIHRPWQGDKKWKQDTSKRQRGRFEYPGIL